MAHQLVGEISSFSIATVPPASVAAAMVSSIESTSTYDRGWVNPSVREVSPPPPICPCRRSRASRSRTRTPIRFSVLLPSWYSDTESDVFTGLGELISYTIMPGGGVVAVPADSARIP